MTDTSVSHTPVCIGKHYFNVVLSLALGGAFGARPQRLSQGLWPLPRVPAGASGSHLLAFSLSYLISLRSHSPCRPQTLVVECAYGVITVAVHDGCADTLDPAKVQISV